MKKNKKIVVVDDSPENRQVIARTLDRKLKNIDIFLMSDGEVVLEDLENQKTELPDLILMDIMMPGIDGFTATEKIKKNDNWKEIPIIFLTAVTEMDTKVKAFELGGVDYITKPFNKMELLARVKTHLQLKEMTDNLNELVKQKSIALITALEKANVYNDTDTGKHISRVSEYSALLAKKYGCTPDYVEKIRLYASLHDVGKIGLSDKLLKKPGKYTKKEFKEMKDHVKFGKKIVEELKLGEIAENIIFYHHEKWDGTGYVSGLKGEAIPLEARIVTLADVYDALGSKRVYKDAFSENKIDKIILEGKNKHFDPKLVDIYFDSKKEILDIKSRLKNKD
ncbi:MAG: HD-GYP domain-containing protein [Fusobacteriota bacterium]